MPEFFDLSKNAEDPPRRKGRDDRRATPGSPASRDDDRARPEAEHSESPPLRSPQEFFDASRDPAPPARSARGRGPTSDDDLPGFDLSREEPDEADEDHDDSPGAGEAFAAAPDDIEDGEPEGGPFADGDFEEDDFEEEEAVEDGAVEDGAFEDDAFEDDADDDLDDIPDFSASIPPPRASTQDEDDDLDTDDLDADDLDDEDDADDDDEEDPDDDELEEPEYTALGDDGRELPSPDAFLELGIDPDIARAVAEEGYTTPTEVQTRSIPDAINGKDLLGLAQTGTGKTAAFSIPILHRLHNKPRRGPRTIRALILTPTRELAIQVHDSLRAYGRHLSLRATVILGGVSAVPQIAELKKTPDILVATPGRLLDLMSQGHISLEQIETFVLDEADRMLDMGFIHDVKKVVAKLPEFRQTLFFSATMPKEVEQLANQLLVKPSRVEVTPRSTAPRKIDQKVFMVARLDKRKLLAHLLKNTKGARRVLVFSRTKRRADTIARHVKKLGIGVAAIHSNKTQGARQKALNGFMAGKVRVLIATDIVARGIDVDEITHVINYDLPHEPESYVHRIGRTARAGAIGAAFSFCDGEEIPLLKQIEKVMQRPIEVETDHPFHATEFEPRPVEDAPRGRGGRAGRGERGGRGGRSDGGRSEGGRSEGGRASGGRGRGSRGERGRRPREEAGFVEDSPRRSRRRGSHGAFDRERDRERSPEDSSARRGRGRRGPDRDDAPERERGGRGRSEERSSGRTRRSERGPDRRSESSRDSRPKRDPFTAGLDDNFGDSSNLFGGGGRVRPEESFGGGPSHGSPRSRSPRARGDEPRESGGSRRGGSGSGRRRTEDGGGDGGRRRGRSGGGGRRSGGGSGGGGGGSSRGGRRRGGSGRRS